MKKNKILICKKTNEWISDSLQKPDPTPLFGDFWFENELSILFADTNTGKSILAVQIAESIAKGEGILGLHVTDAKHKVLYCDFELSPKQPKFKNSTQQIKKNRFVVWKQKITFD